MDIPYSVSELRRLYATAKQLGFADDVAHWAEELKKKGVTV